MDDCQSRVSGQYTRVKSGRLTCLANLVNIYLKKIGMKKRFQTCIKVWVQIETDVSSGMLWVKISADEKRHHLSEGLDEGRGL